jgi:hypothetical protein
MSGKRRRFTARTNRWKVWSFPAATGDQSVLRSVSREQGQTLLRAGRVREVLDAATDRLLGYEYLQPCHVARYVAAAEAGVQSGSEASATCLTSGEMKAIAGCFGPSRTEGLPEYARLERVRRAAAGGRRAEMEDAVERAKAKLEAYRPRWRA